MEKDYLREKVEKRIKDEKEFYEHLVVYVIVNIGLFFVNFFVSRGQWWFYWATIGWGIGLAFHFYSTFISSNLLGAQWEEKRRAELEKEYGIEDKDNKDE